VRLVLRFSYFVHRAVLQTRLRPPKQSRCVRVCRQALVHVGFTRRVARTSNDSCEVPSHVAHIRLNSGDMALPWQQLQRTTRL
jgi:hypothetical protein